MEYVLKCYTFCYCISIKKCTNCFQKRKSSKNNLLTSNCLWFWKCEIFLHSGDLVLLKFQRKCIFCLWGSRHHMSQIQTGKRYWYYHCTFFLFDLSCVCVDLFFCVHFVLSIFLETLKYPAFNLLKHQMTARSYNVLLASLQ